MRGNLHKESSKEVNLCVCVSFNALEYYYYYFVLHCNIFRYEVAWNKSWNLFLTVQNNEMTGVLYISIILPNT